MPTEEVSECERGVHQTQDLIQRAQAHSVPQMCDRQLRFAGPHPNPTTEIPSRCEIRIQYECTVDKPGSAVHVACEIGNGKSRSGEGDGIILAQFRCPSSEPHGFPDLVHWFGHPAIRLSPHEAPRCHPIGCGEIWIALNGFVCRKITGSSFASASTLVT